MKCNTHSTTPNTTYQPVCCLVETLDKLSNHVSRMKSLLWMYRAFESCTREPSQSRTVADTHPVKKGNDGVLLTCFSLGGT